MGKKIRVSSTGRLHISLIDLHGYFSKRCDGGAGFSISEPGNSIVVNRQEDGKISVTSHLQVPIAGELLSDIKSTLERVQKHYKLGGITAEVERVLPLHAGFGSKTQTLLAAAAVYCRLYRTTYDYREIARIIGRGGTSGIGVEAFVSGGFIVDCGHSFESKDRHFRPSCQSKHITPAPLVGRYHFPDWPVLVVTPTERRQFFGGEEQGHWNKICPIPLSDAQACSHIVLMMLIPSVIESHLENFCDGINAIQTLAWKRSLIDAQSAVVRKTMEYLRQTGLQGVGLSSAGATIYAFGSILAEKASAQKVLQQVRDFLSKNGGGNSFITTANNSAARFTEFEG